MLARFPCVVMALAVLARGTIVERLTPAYTPVSTGGTTYVEATNYLLVLRKFLGVYITHGSE